MSTYYVAGLPYSDELYHYGIKGQKWGIRRYQNPDGTLTEEGKRRYGTIENFNAERNAQRNRVSNITSRLTKNVKRNTETSQKSKKGSEGNFISKHKKGIAIAGGLLAAGIGAALVSKAINNKNTKNGSSLIQTVLSDYGSKTTPFDITMKFEPSSFEPSRFEPSRFEPSRFEPSRFEPRKF